MRNISAVIETYDEGRNLVINSIEFNEVENEDAKNEDKFDHALNGIELRIDNQVVMVNADLLIDTIRRVKGGDIMVLGIDEDGNKYTDNRVRRYRRNSRYDYR